MFCLNYVKRVGAIRGTAKLFVPTYQYGIILDGLIESYLSSYVSIFSYFSQKRISSHLKEIDRRIYKREYSMFVL